MADYLHYFFDLHSGYKDATRYSQGLLALLDVSGTSIAQRLINAGYGKNDYRYKKGLLHINSYSKTTAVTHKHAVVIDDGSECHFCQKHIVNARLYRPDNFGQ